jgi:hypothetical protein
MLSVSFERENATSLVLCQLNFISCRQLIIPFFPLYRITVAKYYIIFHKELTY